MTDSKRRKGRVVAHGAREVLPWRNPRRYCCFQCRRSADLEAHAYAADIQDEPVCDGGGERKRADKCLYFRQFRGCWGGYLPKRTLFAER